VPGFTHVPFNDINAIQRAITNNTCAIMLEPIQGEGGVTVPEPDYLKAVRKICDENNLLFILDEVQTGMGRTGKFFAHEHFGITPDIMTIAKGLGGGTPIGAMLATDKISIAFGPTTHATTFGGNPLVCAAAVATIETLLEDGFILDQCNRMSEYMKGRLGNLREKFPTLIVEIRGLGLLLGMELTRNCEDVVNACLEMGILVNCTAEKVLRFMPPLIVQKRHIDSLINILEKVFGKLPQ